jgi:cytochrome c556
MSVMQQITQVATIIIALAIVVLVLVAIPMAVELRRLQRRVYQLLERTSDDIAGIVRNVNRVSENVQAVSAALRGDVDKLDAALHDANERVQRALSATEEQLGEFNALITVAREEAEDLFLNAASTVRGVQRGARAFRRRGGMDLASDELDAAEAADDMMTQEEGDGHDSSPESTAAALPAAPRIRPRSGSRRRA